MSTHAINHIFVLAAPTPEFHSFNSHQLVFLSISHRDMAVFASSPHHWQLNKPLSSSSSSSLHSLQNPIIMFLKFTSPDNQFFDYQKNSMTSSSSSTLQRRTSSFTIVNALDKDSNNTTRQDDEVKDAGVKAALSVLKFYKREISPLLPNSCRYVPTCSEYSMEAYKKYGVVKGTVLTAWRLCRCNPLGGSGFDPPRWFDEASPPEQ